MPRIKSVKARPDWKLEIVFSDGVSGEISIKDRLFGPIFEPLKDIVFFERVRVDEFGAVCWPNGADLAPDAIYERLKAAEGIPASA